MAEAVANKDIAHEGKRLCNWIEDLADESAGNSTKRRATVEKLAKLSHEQLAAVLIAITLYEESVSVVRQALEGTAILTGAFVHLLKMDVPTAYKIVKEIKDEPVRSPSSNGQDHG